MITNQETILCPSCKTEINVSDVLQVQIEARIRKQCEKEAREKFIQREQDIQRQSKIDAENECTIEMNSLKLREKELMDKLTESRRVQVEMIEEKRKLQDEREAFEINKQKKIEEAEKQIKIKERERIEEENRMKFAEKDKKIADVTAALEKVQRQIWQGSQQTQGEVAELNLENELKRTFIFDKIESVPKGKSGADIIQKVRSKIGVDCGKIVWEVKNTKIWSEGWVQKLKDDQREVFADIAIIVSRVLPNGIESFGIRDGVYVCSMYLAIPIAEMIRNHLEAITKERGFSIGKNEKMEALYQYLTGRAFRQRLEVIKEVFSSVRSYIEKEKSYFAKKWATLEMTLNKVQTNIAGVYGDIDGMINLPEFPILSLDYDETMFSEERNQEEIVQ